MKKLFLIIILSFLVVPAIASANMGDHLKGKILLQVEDKGKAWYVLPEDGSRVYLGKPKDAFRVIHQAGVGLSEKDYNSWAGKAPKRLAGKIFLRVEANGEAYYINPDTLELNYLGRPDDAFNIMREQGLGISNENINKITESTKYREKVNVELFVMSYCPYGLQIEKGIIPVVKALDNDINFELKFVPYVIHGEEEITEQLDQYCIQKEEPEKIIDYLKCFAEAAQASSCMKKLNIDIERKDACIVKVEEEYKVTELYKDKDSWLSGRYPLFNTNKESAEKYGVQASPTLVVNSKVVYLDRDSQSLMNEICNAFETKPEVCSKKMSINSPSPGFGYSESDRAAQESCE